MPLSFSVFNYTAISVLLFSYAVGTSLLDLRQSNPSIFTTNNKSSTTFFNYYGHLLYEVLKNLATSEIKLLLVANMAANCVLLTFKSVLFLILGKLRDIERSSLNEQIINYVLFKVVFIGAVLEPDVIELLLWSSWFCLIGFFKMLTFIAKSRAEHHNVSPIITKSERVKLLGLLFCILGFDLIWSCSAVLVFEEAGLSTLCLLLFEPVLVAIESILIIAKYFINGQLGASNDNSDSELDDGGITLNDQEESVVLHFSILYYAELLSTLLKLSLKLSHFIHIWTLNGLSFTLIDAILFLNMRSAILKLKSKITSHMNYRNIVIALEKNSTTVEEISEIDDVCAICLRTMTKNVKRLPCGHYYHFSCLCKWLERIETKPTCPVCRKPLLSDDHNHHHHNNGNNVNNDSPNTTNLDYDAINVNNLDPITTAMMNTDTTRLSLNLSLNLNVEGQTTNDSEAGGRFSSILSWPSWLPTPQFSFIVTPTPLNSNGDNDNNNNGGDNNGGRDLLTGDRNMDDMDDFIGNTRMMDEDDINIDYAADNGNVENFSLAEPFLSNPVERHIAFQMRKTKLLNEARRRYKEKEEEQMRILENSQSHFSSYFF